MTETLKPCPFCGGTSATIVHHDDFCTVLCDNVDCQAEGPCDLGESGAIERWNERSQSPGVKELAEAVQVLYYEAIEVNECVEDVPIELWDRVSAALTKYEEAEHAPET